MCGLRVVGWTCLKATGFTVSWTWKLHVQSQGVSGLLWRNCRESVFCLADFFGFYPDISDILRPVDTLFSSIPLFCPGVFYVCVPMTRSSRSLPEADYICWDPVFKEDSWGTWILWGTLCNLLCAEYSTWPTMCSSVIIYLIASINLWCECFY